MNSSFAANDPRIALRRGTTGSYYSDRHRGFMRG